MEFFRQFNVSFRQTKTNKEEKRRGKSEPRKPEFMPFLWQRVQSRHIQSTKVLNIYVVNYGLDLVEGSNIGITKTK